MSKYKKLDDFILVHRTNEKGYNGILRTGELRSSDYMAKKIGMEAEYGWGDGGDPKYIYFTLYKKSCLDELIDNPIYKNYSVFYFDPKMLLNYKDNISFPVNKNNNQYKRFLGESDEGFKDLWPHNETEELALNLHHYWSLFQEWWYSSLSKDDSFNQGIPTNELMIKTDFIPIKDYMIKFDPGLKWDANTKRWILLNRELF
jgi:hypothetical protein